ncbi:MAG: M42 family metallopeptidase [Chitinophagales bacterium]|nr:M42 family metallopeptidase [Chitinophagales bacterium]MDW8417923.1 M42 family metallopeptidase [Chitinophagales bacterium]
MATRKSTTASKPKALITADDLRFLSQYINTPSPTGFEANGQKCWLSYLKPAIDDYEVDTYGTVYGVMNPGAGFKVVIEAHADEISWFVSYITDDGFIYVRRNGGSDHQIAPSKRVWIHLRNGEKIPAVFGWPAIHTRKEGKEQAPDVKNIFLDCGAKSKKEVEALGIHVGCVITYQDEFTELNNRYYVGRALDNRIGGFMIAKVARLLRENKVKLPYTLYIVNAVQEEVGLRGAGMIAHTLHPDCAIVTDVCHDTSTPMIDKIAEGDYKCGEGPVLTIGPAVHNKFLDLVINTARKSNIKVQMEAVSRYTGTDTDAIAYTRGGIPSVLISLPMRYMHTTVEMVAKDDVENVIWLMYQTLLNLKPGFDFKYLK